MFPIGIKFLVGLKNFFSCCAFCLIELDCDICTLGKLSFYCIGTWWQQFCFHTILYLTFWHLNPKFKENSRLLSFLASRHCHPIYLTYLWLECHMRERKRKSFIRITLNLLFFDDVIAQKGSVIQRHEVV